MVVRVGLVLRITGVRRPNQATKQQQQQQQQDVEDCAAGNRSSC